MVQCPNCGYNNADNSSFCVSCGRSLPSAPRQPQQQQVRTVAGNTAPKGGGKLVIGVILAGIGIFFTFFGGFWMISIPSLILAAYIASQSSEGLGKELVPRLSLAFIAVTIGYMNIIPENKFISVVLLTAASIGIIMSLPAETIKKDASGNVLERSFSGVKYARTLQVIVYSFGLIGTGLWTYF
ncbi:MAG TPA: zinc ribbon domain-containing protein, partial [Candidatus Nanoarchaeia archaeon]|nr:zinc ribbon domain-containing protein [Candidatus Nanoarchaeia archaeon]